MVTRCTFFAVWTELHKYLLGELGIKGLIFSSWDIQNDERLRELFTPQITHACRKINFF
jgi:hypothetical protein